MRWNVKVVFEVYKGRKCIFSLAQLLPFLRRWRKQNRADARRCFAKTRYKTEQAAKNAEWFKKRPEKLFGAYLCDICDGWHITTKPRNPT